MCMKNVSPRIIITAVPIQLQASLNVMAAWAGDARLRDLPIESFAFLDTETPGFRRHRDLCLPHRAGRFVNGELSCSNSLCATRRKNRPAGRPWKIPRFRPGTGDLQGKASMCRFSKLAIRSTPSLFRSRIRPPRPASTGEGLWRDRLESRALNISKKTSCLRRAPSKKCQAMRSRIFISIICATAMRALEGRVLSQCMDVVAMAALLNHTAKMLEDPFHEGIEHGLDVIALAKLYEGLGQWTSRASL